MPKGGDVDFAAEADVVDGVALYGEVEVVDAYIPGVGVDAGVGYDVFGLGGG